MKNRLLFILLVANLGGNAWARRAPVPLMPIGYDRSSASAPATVPAQTFRTTDRYAYERPASQMGIELGIVGRKQSTDADVLGVQALLGARAFLWLPVYRTFTLKPSVGYFYKKENVGSVSVSQSHIEGGIGALITVLQEESLKWHLGVSNRITRFTSTSSIFGSASTSPASWFIRSGPTTGMLVRLGGRIHLAADFEYTWSFERPTRSYMGLTSGLSFEL